MTIKQILLLFANERITIKETEQIIQDLIQKQKELCADNVWGGFRYTNEMKTMIRNTRTVKYKDLKNKENEN